MTTEENFRKKLDAKPDDWRTRLAFADWLQERNDPRAEGHRALAALRKQIDTAGAQGVWWRVSDDGTEYPYPKHVLPKDWYNLMTGATEREQYDIRSRDWFATHRAAEDSAALAFGKLSAQRRTELLAGRTRSDKRR